MLKYIIASNKLLILSTIGIVVLLLIPLGERGATLITSIVGFGLVFFLGVKFGALMDWIGRKLR